MSRIPTKEELFESYQNEDSSPFEERQSWDMDEGMPSAKIMQTADVSKIKWTNRRKHAWLSLFALIGMSILTFVLIMLNYVNFNDAVPFLQTLAWAFAGVIFAYMGFTAFPLFRFGSGKNGRQ